MKVLLRKIIFWTHLVSGLSAGIVIMIMSVTGVLMTFQAQILNYADSDVRIVQPPVSEAQRIGVQQMLFNVVQTNPSAKPSSITIQKDPNVAAAVSLGRDGTVYVNQYTGEITGESSKSVREFFRTVEDWHRWIGVSNENRVVGRALTGASNLLFFVLAITGIYIWLPRRFSWKSFKGVMLFRRGLRGRARNFNWHNVIGFWSSSILIVLTLTAIVMSYTWANNLLYTLTGNEPPQNQSQQQQPNRPPEQKYELPQNLDLLWAKAEQQVPVWNSIVFRLPAQIGAPATFSIDDDSSWNQMARSNLTLDAQTGEVVKWEPYQSLNAGRQLRTWARFAHTGESLGIIGQILAGLATLGGCFLVWTGFSLAFRRFRSWLNKRKLEESSEPEII
jgi:uncharacterized iron-regulated membrane protein